MRFQEPRWYPSKIDWWLIPLLCLPPIAAVSVFVTSALSGSTIELLRGFGVVLAVLAVYLGLIFPMRYGIDATHLIVRHGVCRQRIQLAEISSVYPTRNPLSSPALSLDRLHVQFGEGFFKAVMISPADRTQFLDEIAQRAGLERYGDCLRRN